MARARESWARTDPRENVDAEGGEEPEVQTHVQRQGKDVGKHGGHRGGES